MSKFFLIVFVSLFTFGCGGEDVEIVDNSNEMDVWPGCEAYFIERTDYMDNYPTSVSGDENDPYQYGSATFAGTHYFDHKETVGGPPPIGPWQRSHYQLFEYSRNYYLGNWFLQLFRYYCPCGINQDAYYNGIEYGWSAKCCTLPWDCDYPI